MLHLLLENQLRHAISEALPEVDVSTLALKVQTCPDPKFGDYQCNTLMGVAKKMKTNPRQVATDVVAKLKVSDWCEPVEIAGPGFLNFRLKVSALTRILQEALAGTHLFFKPVATPRTFVIDFSSPNVAKPMHVGHIRSTILGDCLARILRVLGHTVITDNHIGDWGTQFGKLLVGWKQQIDLEALQADPLAEMERLYKSINAACDTDEDLLELARQELVKLQEGDPENLDLWHQMTERSQGQFDEIYQRLDISFTETLGESFYNDQLKPIVQELQAEGLARESDGAIAVFFDDDTSLKDHPALIQKSDGAANYTTTDLATLAYRLQTWVPDEIVYVTDSRQQLHFKQLFAIFARWHPESTTRLSHVWFGTILGDDGKPFKTRAGGVIKLVDLLNEAEERALHMVTEKNPDMPEDQRLEIARVVGLGAVKYADLLPNRQSDYVFSWEKMLALTGNTAPYLQYAYTRTRSVLRKYETDHPPFKPSQVDQIQLTADAEIALAKHLLNFGQVLASVVEEYRPNYLCNYLYDLAGHFSRFYESCPVLKADPQEMPSRLALCDLSGRVLHQGLTLLGIETLEQM